MTTPAIVMLLISVILLWGGLILSVIHLLQNPDEE